MMKREQCGVRCHLRGFDTGFFAETGCTGEVTTKKMNVLMLNGSPNPNVNTSIVLCEMENVFRENGVESETVFAATGIFTAALRPENASLPTSRTSLSRNSRQRNIACARCGIQLGKEQFGLPAQEEWMPTHFIRRGNRNGGKSNRFP